MTSKHKHQPPHWANRFLRWYCPNVLLEEIEGDLIENFYRQLKEKGISAAKIHYILEVIRFCNPVTFRKAKKLNFYPHFTINTTAMLQSFFISSIRNLKKNKTYTVINVSGLSLGIASCIVIFVIARYETSFDDYHSKADRIYRVNLNQKHPDGRHFNGFNFSPLAAAIREEVTGLEAVTGVHCLWRYQINKENDVYEDKYAFFADQEYFDVFDVKWIAGNQAQALTAPNTVVVTDVFAKKFLGGMDKALGNTFLLENKITLTVTGIVAAPPTNTDHPYSILISFPTLADFLPESIDNWKTVTAGATYVVFNEDTQPDRIYAQFDKIIAKYLGKDFARDTQFFLMALNDNHDRNGEYNNFTYDFPVPLMIILAIVASMIALIACINFVNLATAQSLNRAKEVGIRKTLGSNRFQLILQHMSEAFLITLMAVITGLALAKVGMLKLNAHFDGDFLQFNFLQEPSILLFIAGILLFITLLAGFYPAFILSGYRPVWALKSQKNAGRSKGLSLRRGLVLMQFIGAQILILVTIIMINQINHFKERPMGFDSEAIVLLPYLMANEKAENKDLQNTKFGHELQRVSGILSYTFAYDTPIGGDRVEFYGQGGEDNKHRGTINYGDASYLQTFNMELMSGRNFSPDELQISPEVLVNQTLVKTLGIESPEAAIGAIYMVNGHELRIRGVIKDFYTQPMRSKIDPFTLQYKSEKFAGTAISIATDHVPETLAGIEKAWKSVFPDYLCKYTFMDELLNRRYGFLNTMFTFLSMGALLAIFIGCLGLYGLVSFMAIQRTKEIGIRKVLGASVSGILKIFTRESLVLILISFVIAAPMARLAGIALLMELPERVTPGVGIFVLTLAATLCIAGVTVGYRSFRAASQSPVDSLRSE